MPLRERLMDASRVLRRDGVGAVFSKATQRLSRRAEDFYHWSEKDFPLLWDDVADSAHVRQDRPTDNTDKSAWPKAQSLTIGWVCLPPSAGSGGHTTLFRMVRGMEQRGHKCVIYLYDRDSEDIERHISTIRGAWPELRAEIRSARPRIEGLDAIVASSWETAHVIASRADSLIERFYFVQDYEPFFYPRGPLWELAEDTYRFGFTTIALGTMVASCIQSFAGVEPDCVVPFGCDNSVYKELAGSDDARSGVVFYAKKLADRRGYWLAKQALEVFHRTHPEQTIHVVGDRPIGWSIPLTVHGNIEPAALNALYNAVLAGIALSFTNISLAAEEMLASGAIPIVNNSPLAKMDLATDGPLWAAATPQGIAAGLSTVVEMDRDELRARRHSFGIRQGWTSTSGRVADFIESRLNWSAGSKTTERRPRLQNILHD